MATAERQAMTLEQDQLGPQPAAASPRQSPLRPAPTPGMLDPLVRALDRAVMRSAQQNGGVTAARD